jgi:hypothetical protein
LFVSESITGWEVTNLAPFLASVLVLPVILPRTTSSFPKVMIDVAEIVMTALFVLTLRILGPDLAHIGLEVFLWWASVLMVEYKSFCTKLAVLHMTVFVSLLKLRLTTQKSHGYVHNLTEVNDVCCEMDYRETFQISVLTIPDDIVFIVIVAQ